MDLLVLGVVAALVVVAGLRTLLGRRTPTRSSSVPPGRPEPTDRTMDQGPG